MTAANTRRRPCWEGVDIVPFLPRPYLDDNSRTLRDLERTLRAGAGAPRVNYDKGKIEGQRLDIQRILDSLNIPSSLLDRDDSIDERALQLESLSLDSPTTISRSENGRS